MSDVIHYKPFTHLLSESDITGLLKFSDKVTWTKKETNHFVYIPITFYNPLEACFSNKTDLITIPNTPDTNCKGIFLIKTPVFNGFLIHTRISN